VFTLLKARQVLGARKTTLNTPVPRHAHVRWFQGAIASHQRVCLTVPIIEGSAVGGSRHEIVETYCRLTSPTRQQQLWSRVMQ